MSMNNLFKTVLCSVCVFMCAPAFADEMSIPSGEEIFYNIPQGWQEVENLEQREALIRLTVAALNSNLEKISTFKGRFAVSSDFRYDKSVMNSDGIFDVVFESDPIWHRDFTAEIVSDRGEHKIYRNVKTVSDYFEYEGKRMEREPQILIGTVSIDSPDEYVYSQNGDFFQGVDNELPGHPNLPADNIAWVEQPEYNDNWSYTDNIDPYLCYDPKRWGSLDGVLRFMEGKLGAEQQQVLNERAHVFETTDSAGIKWFRYQQSLNDGLEYNVLWNDSVDFLPVYYAMVTESGAVVAFHQARWDKMNGVFVPVEMVKVVNSESGKPENRYRTVIADVHVNEPVGGNQFSYSALGLNGESLIVNRIEKKVYTLKNGKPVFLAKFNTPSKTPHADLHISKARVMIVVLGLVMVAAGLFLRRRPRLRAD